MFQIAVEQEDDRQACRSCLCSLNVLCSIHNDKGRGWHAVGVSIVESVLTRNFTLDPGPVRQISADGLAEEILCASQTLYSTVKHPSSRAVLYAVLMWLLVISSTPNISSSRLQLWVGGGRC